MKSQDQDCGPLVRRPGLRRRFTALIAGAVAAFAAFGGSGEGQAQANNVIQRGDAVVTGFAGTVAPDNLPQDVHPLDRTFIDLQGLTAQIFDLSNLGGGPNGQLANAPVKYRARANQVGHVFGIAFEGDGGSTPPNIFLAASSMFGLQIVKQEGNDTRRLVNGEAGAKFMPGQFGPGRGGPGSIWRVDGRTGEIRLFANVPDNKGAALGNLTYDSRTKQLFAADLQSGMIHRFTMDGRLRDSFDHGVSGRLKANLPVVEHDASAVTGIENPSFNVEDASTWGYAPPSRMVFAVAIQGQRLYYSVADGPQIWSVGIDGDGDFANDARLEIEVKDTPANGVVTKILFDGAGMMYIAQRGEFTGSYDYQLFAKPQQSVVLRYQWDEQRKQWTEAPEEYAIGLKPEHRATVGGIALNYGYDRNGRINYGACRQTLWTTGEHLREGDDVKRVSTGGASIVHGLQGNYKSMVRPANEPPYETWFVDYDGKFEDGEINGHIGNVAIFNICGGSQTTEAMAIPTYAPGEPHIVIEKVCFPTIHGGRVRCLITLRNTGGSLTDEDIVFIEDTRILVGPFSGRPVLIAEVRPDGDGWLCSPTGAPEFTCRLSAHLLTPGSARVVEVWVDTADILINGGFGFRNCAILRHKHGHNRACHEGGTDIVIEKTGPAVCQPGGICRWGLTVTNRGDRPFSGDVQLSDMLTTSGAPLNAPIVSISQPTGCASEPTQVPFSCTASLSLAPGESRTTFIDVKLPPGGGIVLENCFFVRDPKVNVSDDVRARLVRMSDDKRREHRHMSCVRTRVPWPEQPRDVPSIPAPPGSSGFIPLDPVCWNGRAPLPNGRCACPGDTRWDPSIGECRQPPERICYDPVRTMPNGKCCPWGTRWDPSTWSCRPRHDNHCSDPSRRMPSGDCCPSGTRWNWRSKSCDAPQTCENGRPPLPNGLCGCPINTRWDPVTRSCGKPGDQTGGKCPDGSPKAWGGQCKCPEGSRWNTAAQSCVKVNQPKCTGNQVWNPNTKSCETRQRCPLNRPVWNPQTKSCESSSQICPAGQRMMGGKCQDVQTQTCPNGQKMVGGKCPDTQTQTCPNGQKMVGGKCPDTQTQICPAGQRMMGGKCQDVQTQTCPNGQKMVGGKCPDTQTQGCPQGQHKVGNACVPDTTRKCPDNQLFINGACRPVQTSNQKPGDCKPGFEKTASGACLPKSVTQRCGAGQIKQADGSCKTIDKKIVPKKIDKKVVTPKKVERQVPKKTTTQKIEKKPVPKRVPQNTQKKKAPN